MKIPENFYRDTALPQQALNVWDQIAESVGNSFQKAPMDRREALFKVLGNSNFLSRWARRHPDDLALLLQEDWQHDLSLKEFNLQLQSILKNQSKAAPEQFQQKLLEFKYRHLFRITARDLGYGKPFPTIAFELSALAVALMGTVLKRERDHLEKEWGPMKIPFVIMGMGKLGGMELNYSSDVDVIYFYESDDSPTAVSPNEFFCKLGERISRLLSQKAPSGFLYRVDLDLRPEGPSGALANSLPAMEYYYENFGAFWEKQAMIKASMSAGSPELFKKFHQMIHPFVYPKTSDFSLLKKVQEMKGKVLVSLQKSSEQGYHVKLGPGGIREIEFFVQSLQILYGGQIPQLETPNSLAAMHQLKKAGILGSAVEQTLREAYVFLRTLENRLQQVEEQQTHRIPESEEERLQTVRRMGYRQNDPQAAMENFEKDLKKHCQFVETTFASLLTERFKDFSS